MEDFIQNNHKGIKTIETSKRLTLQLGVYCAEQALGASWWEQQGWKRGHQCSWFSRFALKAARASVTEDEGEAINPVSREI